VHVHNNFVACTSHNDFSVGCCTWLGFFVSPTHLSQCTFITSWFVTDDNSFILGFLCYHWLSFRHHESSLHKVFIWFICWLFTFVFSWVVSTCVLFCLVLLMDGFSSFILIYKFFFSFSPIFTFLCSWWGLEFGSMLNGFHTYIYVCVCVYWENHCLTNSYIVVRTNSIFCFKQKKYKFCDWIN
jgi:hypothetical protein